MTMAYFCVVFSIFIPLFCAVYAKMSVKGYNNRRPREFLNSLDGKARRAHDAQLNFYEGFAPFACGVIIAHQLHAPQTSIDFLASTFVMARILYAFFYIADNHSARTMVWFIGLGATIALYFIGM